MKLPIDAEVLSHEVSEDDGNGLDLEIILKELLLSREKTFKSAAGNIDNAQKKQKETYDRKHLPEEFPIGAKVLVENSADKQRKGGKLNPSWYGPNIISKYHGKGVYQLSNQAGDVIRTKVNAARLELYTKRPAKGCEGEGKERMREDNNNPPPKKQCVRDARLKLYTKRPAKGCEGKGKKRMREDNNNPPPKKQCVQDKLVQEILRGKELTDEHMSFASMLLEQQFPYLDGLQSTLLAQNNGFSPVRSDCDSIQIHHTGEFHWVTSAASNGTIKVYDAKFSHFPQACKCSLPLFTRPE